MFLIKSIFLVIVNKKPPSKKVPLLLFQFPSPPTWNNWLSHLLNLYSFVINLYSSSSPLLRSNHLFVSSHLLLPSPFFFPSHKATWSWRMAGLAASGPFWPVLAAVSVGIRPYRSDLTAVLAWIGPYRLFQLSFLLELARIRANRSISAELKRKGELAHRTPHQGKSGTGAAALEPHPCFLNFKS